MVNKLLLMALIVFSIGANAQQTHNYYLLSEKHKQLTTDFLDNNINDDNYLHSMQNSVAINRSKETIWVEDSIKTYTRRYEHTPDSVIVHDWFQNTFFKVLNRNEKGNMTHAIYFQIPPNNDDKEDDPLPPIKTDSITVTYHNNDTLYQYYARPWNDIAQEWVSDTSRYKEYNENGKIIKEVYKDWNRENNLGFSSGEKADYMYANENGTDKLFFYRYYSLNVETGEYTLVQKKFYTYTQDTIFVLEQRLNPSDEFQDYCLETYIYYGDTAMQYIQDYYLPIWTTESKIYYSYNENRDETYILAQVRNAGSEDNWINSYQIFKEYNELGNPVSRLSQIWDENNNEWINYRLYTYNYNIDNNLIYTLIKAWNYLDEWENAHQFFYTYDSNGNKIQLHAQSADMMSGEWEDVYKEDYYWNEFETSAITDINKNVLNIYPNPAKDKIILSSSLSLQNSDVQIYSVSGKLILNTNLKTNTINVSSLAKGIYFIKINTKQKQIIKKFMKE